MTKPAIYDQHDAAFRRVQAFVIARNGERVATIAFKFPADGAGRLYAYVHWLGTEMVRGHANGYGYDKRSAACADAANKGGLWDAAESENNAIARFRNALALDDGYRWDTNLERAGFQVWQAV
jgi:hypothetical protein